MTTDLLRTSFSLFLAVTVLIILTGRLKVHAFFALLVPCLIPPHPGAAAAASAIGVDYGKLILSGLCLAVPALLAGHFWAVFAGKRYKAEALATSHREAKGAQPPAWMAFLPILVPVLL